MTKIEIKKPGYYPGEQSLIGINDEKGLFFASFANSFQSLIEILQSFQYYKILTVKTSCLASLQFDF